MSAVFLLVSGHQVQSAARANTASSYVPFVAEGHRSVVTTGGKERLDVWWTVPEAARGAYLHTVGGTRTGIDAPSGSGVGTDHSTSGRQEVDTTSAPLGCAVFDGQIAESSEAPLSQSVAEMLYEQLTRDGWDAAASKLDGDWTALSFEEDGPWLGTTDFLGACHLYYGERNGVAVVSNRAMVAATALWGKLPSPKVGELAFLHAAFSCPLGLRTCWPGIEMSPPNAIVEVRQGQVTVRPKQTSRDGETMGYQEAIDELVVRAAAVSRFPALDFRLTVTGGKDSRAVLGALHAGGHLDRISTCYLEGDPNAPDAIVGRALAEHYGLDFVVDPAPLSLHRDLFEGFAVHNFQAELFLSAWDLKGATTKPRHGDVRGYYGEIYKTHDLAVFKLGWPAVRTAYLNPLFLDPWRILTRAGRNYLTSAMRGYLSSCEAAGYQASGMHHRFHREMRMARWCGQAQRSDAMGSLALNPLASQRLYQRYFTQSYGDRKNCRIHYELIQRADSWLAAQPFADFQWNLPKVPSAKPQAAKGAVFAKSSQLVQWERQGADLVGFLADSGPAGTFFDIYDRKALLKLGDKALAKPTHRRLKAVMAACAIKHALQFGIAPRPFTVS